jgi:Family of unknown function (DUF6247)
MLYRKTGTLRGRFHRSGATGRDNLAAMSAQPIQDYGPDDPVEILRILPERFHGQFRSEYETAAVAARRPEGYRALYELLRLWRLTAAAYSAPGFEGRLAAVREAYGPAARPVPCRSSRPSRTGPAAAGDLPRLAGA